MFKILTDLPDRVLAVSAVGKITADDYEKVLMPMVEEKLTKYGKVRILYQIGNEFNTFSMMALWDDAKFGLAHWKDWEKIAVVSNIGWLRGTIWTFKWLMPSKFKLFQNAKLEQAKQWICGDRL
ncbi:STAS/SEC14 domain-containing protein [Spirulina sp. 06S082]|uniref:STAS/SEC14 domain-containing protein n=1 Tax=Spirulina sp. 06S082 TaxID=3110248 RepID=UPI002B209EEE|nr:STAS/SEC14 domain-containing protein [Spirulina sp. 06S082]MEA5468274.1 STAS/SEC14 domain-containing protein [Spirulina sp. 06S082]